MARFWPSRHRRGVLAGANCEAALAGAFDVDVPAAAVNSGIRLPASAFAAAEDEESVTGGIVDEPRSRTLRNRVRRRVPAQVVLAERDHTTGQAVVPANRRRGAGVRRRGAHSTSVSSALHFV